MTTPYGAPLPDAGPTCPRHSDQVTYVTCQRCGRPACPACQVPAAVGVHCVDCSAQARRDRPVAVRRAQAADGPPYLTYGLAGVVAACYVVQLAVPSFTAAMALVPRLAWGEPWRLLTTALVHDPDFPLHVIGNLLLLVLLGRVVEPALGRAPYVVMCLLSALGGSVAVLWTASPPMGGVTRDLSWFTPVIGLSTVGYGLMCALLALSLRGRGDARGVMMLLLLNVGFSLFVSNVSWQGHLGGAVAGFVTTWALSAGVGASGGAGATGGAGASGGAGVTGGAGATAGSPVAAGSRAPHAPVAPRRASSLSSLSVRTAIVACVGLALMAAAIVGRYALVSPFWGGIGG